MRREAIVGLLTGALYSGAVEAKPKRPSVPQGPVSELSVDEIDQYKYLRLVQGGPSDMYDEEELRDLYDDPNYLVIERDDAAVGQKNTYIYLVGEYRGHESYERSDLVKNLTVEFNDPLELGTEMTGCMWTDEFRSVIDEGGEFYVLLPEKRMTGNCPAVVEEKYANVKADVLAQLTGDFKPVAEFDHAALNDGEYLLGMKMTYMADNEELDLYRRNNDYRVLDVEGQGRADYPIRTVYAYVDEPSFAADGTLVLCHDDPSFSQFERGCFGVYDLREVVVGGENMFEVGSLSTTPLSFVVSAGSETLPEDGAFTTLNVSLLTGWDREELSPYNLGDSQAITGSFGVENFGSFGAGLYLSALKSWGGEQSSGLERAMFYLGPNEWELGDFRFSPALTGGWTWNPEVSSLSNVPSAGLLASLEYGQWSLGQNDLGIQCALRVARDFIGDGSLYPNMAVQCGPQFSRTLSGSDVVVDLEMQEVESAPVSSVQIEMIADYDISYIAPSYSAENLSEKERAQLSADHVRHSEEAKSLASRNAWEGVNKHYLEMEALWEQGIVLSYDDHWCGALAARALGDVNATSMRLVRVSSVASKPEQFTEVNNWMTDIENNYGHVLFVVDKNYAGERVLQPAQIPFPPDQRSAVEYAQKVVKMDGKHELRLPKGVYTIDDVTFEVTGEGAVLVTLDASSK